LITVFFSRSCGKLTAIAKSAKKSRKRFAGILELFSVLTIVTGSRRGKGLAVLQEASLRQPFSGIRSDILKTAYASYWVELVDVWMEPGQSSRELFDLLVYVLEAIDIGTVSAGFLSVLFQLRFMAMAGFSPNFEGCTRCGAALDWFKADRAGFELERGGLLCPTCAPGGHRVVWLSKGTVKELLWVAYGDLEKAARIRFSSRAAEEGLRLLEAFVPFHLGREPRSLRFLRQIRRPDSHKATAPGGA